MSSVILQPYDDGGPRPYLVIPVNDRIIWRLVYLPDGRRVVSSSDDGTVRVWNLENREEEGTLMEHKHAISSLALTRDGTKIISGDDDRKIKVWDVESHEIIKEWAYPDFIPSIAISPDDRLFAVGDRIVGIYTMAGQQVNHSIEVGRRVWSMSFSPDGDKLACGTPGDICVYHVKSGALMIGPLKGHKDSVWCLLWSHDGRRLISGSDDATIRCWNADTGELIGQPWTGHTGGVYSITLSPDRSILASASLDHTVRFWDTTSGRPIGQQLEHVDAVTSVCFSPSGESVASAGWDGKMYLWRVRVLGLNSIAYKSEHVRDSISLLVAEPQPEMSRRSTSLSVQFPPPPDLTPHIIRIQNQYSAGGSFGDVYKCRYHGSPVPMEVAVKSFRFNFTTEGDTGNRSIRMLRRELGIWRRLKHDNIVPFLGIAYGFGMDGTMSLVSLWMPNESLHSFLPKYDDNLGAVHRLQFLLDIANGLHYLHSLLIIHGDLNCNNVLLDADYTARLADFGYASLAGNIPDALVYLQRSTVRPGALRWSAPEQIQSEETFDWTTKSDIYSFGCVALQVLSGKQPWSEIREDVAVVLRLAKGHQPGRPQSRVMDDSYWDLIQDCWSSKEERPDVEVIIPTIQRFLSCLPRPQPLCDLLPSWSSRADSRMDTPALSLSQAAIEDSRWSVDTIESDPPPSVVEHEDRIAMLSHSLSPRRTSRGISTIPTDSVSLPEAPSHSAGEFLGHTYVDEVDAERPQKRQRRE